MRFQLSNQAYFKGLLLLALAANMSWGTASQEMSSSSMASSSETIRSGGEKSSRRDRDVDVDEEAARARVRHLKEKYRLSTPTKPKASSPPQLQTQPHRSSESGTRKSLLSGAAETILNKRCTSCHTENSPLGFFGNHAFAAANAEKIKARILDESHDGYFTHPNTMLTPPERHVLSAWLARGAEDWNN